MEPKIAKMNLAGREFKITNSPISTYANGYATVSLGDTVILANATISDKGREGADFLPLTVDYEENMYAAGKIKGSRFIKREGRPSENAVLISRLTDRPIRPLFPKGTTNEVQLICTALSADLEINPDTTAVNAASMALILSGAPFKGPIGAVRMGYKDNKLIVNPTYDECDEGKLDLIVAGTLDAITMVEAAANEVPEEIILQAFEMAHKHIKEICQFQIDYAKQFEIEKIEAEIVKSPEETVEKVKSFVNEEMLDSVRGKTKKEVNKEKKALEEKLIEHFESEIEAEEIFENDIKEVLGDLLEARMRKEILESETRIDGRKPDEIRSITVIPNYLPRTHGSAIFQRGETMALTITTLGGPGDAQLIDTMDKDITKRYLHHYNFPPYSTGDIKPLRGPSRREIGHGDLAERALKPVIPDKKEFPYTMWLVSEILKCNGSSSMASACGSTLSLMCAGVPIKRPVSGIAMGLVTDKDNPENYKILSDIQGMEDFAGDMDFKVTGTSEGITALQMDIKVKGLSLDIMRHALNKAKEGRDFIMEKMLEVVPEPKKELSKYAPLIMTIKIDTDMIRVLIGKGGETIQEITEECNVEIDIEDDGLVTVTAPDQKSGKKAVEWIKRITYVPKVGDVFEGKVTRILDFGAMVEFLPGKEGLVHISELAKTRIDKVEDVVTEGDTLKVKLIEIDKMGRYNLSHKATLKSGEPPHKNKKEKSGEGHVEGTSAVRQV
ncbi:polyribonucleotide nucleotidyltransferase [Candidatus Peregrinibacteria bacterium]|nr:polyribonucleotide nucleotidyltransferase [Candidatus Peregrinibacteria bacterium]